MAMAVMLMARRAGTGAAETRVEDATRKAVVRIAEANMIGRAEWALE